MPQRRSQAQRTKDLAEDYHAVFDTPTGQRVLADLFTFCHFDKPSYVRGDTHETAFREGERNVLLRVSQILNLDFKTLQEMMKQEREYDRSSYGE